jgi:HPt (histidine-containing phosphotransfer) domain-containing protein
MGADFEDVMSRLRKEERVKRFLLKIPDDQTFALLCDSMEKREMDEAFRAAHTLKGICQNMSLTPLSRSVTRLSDHLKENREYSPELEPMLAQVKEDYAMVSEKIKQLPQDS